MNQKEENGDFYEYVVTKSKRKLTNLQNKESFEHLDAFLII